MSAARPELVPWDEFFPYFRGTWQQGEHVSYIGPTGAGKTTLALAIVPIRKYVIALATKPRDKTMDALSRELRWPITREWPITRTARPAGTSAWRALTTPPAGADHVILWPTFSAHSQANQQRIIYRAMTEAFEQGGWTIFADELFYLCRYLGLTRVLEMLWTQGRSADLTLVGGTQRPAHVPLLAYDQATHLFFWRDNDETNLRRIGGLGGLNSADIRRTVAALPKHHALYLNTRTGEQAIVLAPKPKG